MEPFKRVKREVMHKGTIIDYCNDYIETPEGKKVKYDFIKHHTGAAAVIPVLDNGKILMVRQWRNALDRFTLEIPAGGLDGVDEPTIKCAARELEEETGYKSDNLELVLRIKTTIAFCDENIDIYLARDLKRSHQHLDPDEFINVESYTIDELVKKVFDLEIQDSKTVASILAYKNILDGNKYIDKKI